MKKKVVYFVFMLILCSLVLVLPTIAAQNGKIVFVSERDGGGETGHIFVMNADGSEQTRLSFVSNLEDDPAWSPDGSKIAFSDEKGIVVINAADGSNPTYLVSGWDLSPAWSPDGKKIAFTSDRDGNNEIYVMNADGTGQTRLNTDISYDVDPAWSPDGSKIAFASYRDDNWEIYVMNADGSNPTYLVSGSNPAWSPDGKKIAFDNGIPSCIYVMNADGSNPTYLASGSNPAWSPDGTKIAFTSFLDGSYPIFVMNADGTGQTRLTNSRSNEYKPAWGPATTSIAITSPNGWEGWKRGTSQTITWSYTGSPGSTVKIELLKGSQVGTIASSVPIGSGGKGSYTWPISATGYTGSDYKVSIQSISHPTIKDTSNNYFTITSATSTPSIAFVSSRDSTDSQIFVMNSDGSDQICLTKYPNSGESPEWSPDGKKIAFTMVRYDEQYIYKINVDGTGLIRLTNWPAFYWGLAWSPNGTKIAFSWQEGPSSNEIHVMNADGSNPTYLASGLDPAWSPDGKKIAFESWPNSVQGIYVMNADGSNPTYLASGSAPAWSPDGKKIAFDNDGIYVMNADGSKPTYLASGSNPAWSPDGKKIAFDNGMPSGIYVMNADGSNPTYLASGSNPAWVPAMTLITVTSPNGGETWKRGTSQPITWSYSGNPGSTVKIDLLKGSLVGTIASNVPIGTNGKGSYTWPISSTGYIGSDYKVSVQSTSQPTIKDISNNYFTITSATTAPSINVMSPNGGEKWYKYTTHTITWSYTGSPGSTVKIVLLKGGTPVDTIATNAPIGSSGKGTYSWWIKTSYPSGSDYKVSVQSTSQPTIKDTSNANFGISWP